MTAMNPAEDLFLLAADTLGMVLREEPSGRVEGQSTRQFALGPWKVESKIRAISDVVAPGRVSFLVRVRRSLWFYLVVTRQTMSLYALDNTCLTRAEQDSGLLHSKSVEAALQHFAPSIHGRFDYDATTRCWEAVNADSLDNASIEQDVIDNKSGS